MIELNDLDRTQVSLISELPFVSDGHSPLDRTIPTRDVNHGAKRQHGVYYTPLQVAELLVRWAIRTNGDLILEPSFGGCVFLEASLNHLLKIGCAKPERQLFGFDIDPQAFAHLATLGGGTWEIEKRFIHDDFLSSTIEHLGGRRVDVIVGNPPFVPYRRMNGEQRKIIERWTKANASVVQKDSSLWAYFLQHSLQFLKPGGRMAWVLPSSLLFVEYGNALRTFIQDHFQTTIYIDLQQQLFLDTGTRERTVLLLAEGFSDTPLSASKAATLTFSRLAEVENHFAQEIAPTLASNGFGKQQAALERSADLVAKIMAKTAHVVLGEISKIVIGDVVGDVSYFVKSQAAWGALGINRDELVPILTKSSQVRGIRITKSNVVEMIESGKKCLLLRPNVSAHSKATRNFLATYPADKRTTNATFSRRPTWFLSSYDDSADLFFPSLSSLGPRIVVNSSRVACANSLYRIHLNDDWKAAKFAIALYGTTSFAQLSAELVGGGMGEGALKLNPSHLKQLPLTTDLFDKQPNTYNTFLSVDRLIALGHHDEARKLADEWLSPLVGKKILAQMNTTLEIVRSRRRDYRCEL